MEVTVEKITNFNILLTNEEAQLLRALLDSTQWAEDVENIRRSLLNHLINAGVEAI